MLSSKRLKPIVNLAEMSEENEARKMGEKQGRMQTSSDQLSSLELMRNEYVEKFQASGTLVGAIQLQEFRRFMSKLDQAIIQQNDAVIKSASDFNYQRQNWIQAHSRKRSLEKVSDKCRQNEQKIQDKKEQNEMDERAQRTFSRNMD